MPFTIMPQDPTNMECENCSNDTFYIDRVEREEEEEIFMKVACSKCRSLYLIDWKKAEKED